MPFVTLTPGALISVTGLGRLEERIFTLVASSYRIPLIELAAYWHLGDDCVDDTHSTASVCQNVADRN